LNLNDVQTEAHSTASSSAPPGKTARQVRPVRPFDHQRARIEKLTAL
jgi:hypothetical protein